MKATIGTVFLSSLAIWLCSSVLRAQCTADSVECIHLTLEPKDSGYLLGKPIMMNMLFTNLSDHEIPLSLIHAADQGYGYHFEVIQLATGKRLERTDEGKELAFETMGAADPQPNKGAPQLLVMGGVTIPLEPRETRRYWTILSRIFVFKEPGTYRVEVLGQESRLYVAPITITVQP